MVRKRIFLSGSGGFVGHHFLEHILATTDWDVIATDSFRHRGTTDRIGQVLAGHPEWKSRVDVLTHDVSVPFSDQAILRIRSVDYMVAMASESHVDRSISDPVPFVVNNVQVILNTLELARELRPSALIVISTDEVYGPSPQFVPCTQFPVCEDGNPGNHQHQFGGHAEWSPILPSNPYAASKAAQEAIATSYWRTYGVPAIIVNCMNMVSERQAPEKYVPYLIRSISRGEEVTVHGIPSQIGTRHYLHARNLADGALFLLNGPAPAQFPDTDRPDRYNIVGPDRIDNLTLARMVAAIVGQPLKYRLVDFHSARPGHDPHYGLDGTKMATLGWETAGPVPRIAGADRPLDHGTSRVDVTVLPVRKPIWWIPQHSPGALGDPELWIDESAMDMYGRGDAAPAVIVTGGGDLAYGGPWIGAVIRFDAYPGLDRPVVYQIRSRRHDQHNLGRPYYVARWPD